MRRRVLAAAVLPMLLVAAPSAHAVRLPRLSVAAQEVYADHGVTARVSPAEVVLSNGLIERRWSRAALRTTSLTDLRPGGGTWSAGRRDLALVLPGGVEIGSERFAVTAVRVTTLPRGGLRVAMQAAGGLPGVALTRLAEAYPGVAGIRTRTTVTSLAPLVLAGATLDEAAVGSAAPTLHAFRAGADWREPDWAGPPVAVGDAHPGTWRDTHSAGAGAPLSGPGQWLSLASGGRTLALVAEANDLPSVRAGYDGATGALRLDWGRDVLSLGPFEEQAHLESPLPAGSPGRMRLVGPGAPLELPAAFVALGADRDDEAWQVHRWLAGNSAASYRHGSVFNSNGVDVGRISTGAKDDVDMDTVLQLAPIAKRLGLDTFVLDDGWQAISGDWVPDSPEATDPRGKYPPRFLDADFRAVREAIAPMKLGLWMSPLNFNPASKTFKAHPEWSCFPVGTGTALVNAAQPDDGSNEAGIGIWGVKAIPHVESRIRTAIEDWDVRYFKFDFLVWADCVGQNDMYGHHDAFVAMLDRLQRDHPDVTFQIDETNDYRLFPFESVTHGPSWFQNGSPDVDRLLHNVWNLSPYVPAFSLGQHVLGGRAWERQPVDTLMAAALPTHATVFSELRDIPEAVIERAGVWLRFADANRSSFDGVIHPLLSDPLGRGWTALQSWDHERAAGALLAFRQDSSASTQRIALRAVPPNRTFTLRSAPDGAVVGTATSQELTDGIEVMLPELRGSRVLLIDPA
jgi:hypothetical protein